MTLEQWIKAALGGLLVSLGTCIAGCGPLTWKLDNAKAQGHVGTQFEIGYVSKTSIIIGFPGEVTADAEGAAEGSHTPAPTTGTVTP